MDKYALLSNKLYVPATFVSSSHINSFTYTIKYGDEEETLTSYSYIPSSQAYCFERGNMDKIRDVFSGFDILDKRAAPELGYKLEFTGKLRQEQEIVVERWLEAGGGIIEANPAFGKTVCAVYIMCALGLRTLVLLHEKITLGKGWYDEIRKFTNIDELEEEHGQIVGDYSSTRKSQEPFPITITTYQSFYASDRGITKLTEWADHFGLIWYDEAHVEAADTFHIVGGAFNPKRKGGLTATPYRVDRREATMFDALGPVVAVGKSDEVPIDARLINTGVKINENEDMRRYAFLWRRNRVIRSITKKNSERTLLIVETIIRDILDGRKIMVYTERTKHAYEMYELIKARLVEHHLQSKVHSMAGSLITTNYDDLKEGFKNGSILVCLTVHRMRQGTNLPACDCIHMACAVPNKAWLKQILGRARRPAKGKDRMYVRIYLDSGNAEYVNMARAACRKYLEDNEATIRYIGEKDPKLKIPDDLAWVDIGG